MADRTFIIGVDTGGTFTDVAAINEQGKVLTAKSATTPHDFSIGVMNALEELAKSLQIPMGELLGKCQTFKHGTTIATNALITRTGAKVGLITTRGFEDTTLIARAIGRVAGLGEEEIKHQASCVKPEPLIPRELIRGVTERIDSQGNVLIPINLEEAKDAISSLVEDCAIDALAVNFLFSFMNPIHEKKIKEMLKEMYGANGVFCSFAYELVPVVREYARSNTVLINSFLGKTVSNYISDLSTKLYKAGYKGSLSIMQANGGIVDESEISPIGTLSSGPAGGILGSKYMADTLGHKQIITTDMGGTSFDVGLIVDGSWRYAREPVVERFHITWPMIAIESIGAGGGTKCRVDPMIKRLIVGPDSAGADPGPACYDMGGLEPTITDADLILGLINPDYFLGGRKKLSMKNAEKAIREKIAVPLNLDVVEAAAGIYDVINAHMSDLIRRQVVNTGHIPEEFVLYAFGGAGAVHAAAYGSNLGIEEVYIFPTSAVFSAFGIASADIVHTHATSFRYQMPVKPELLNNKLAEIEQGLLNALRREGINPADVELRRTFHMRYKRQLNELDLQVPTKTYTAKDISDIIASFDKRYEETYGEGTAYREGGIELISMTIDAVGKTAKPKLVKYSDGGKDPSTALKGNRKVFFTGKAKGFLETNIFEYDRLLSGNLLEGPAIIETPITTIVVPPGKKATIDSGRNVIIRLKD